MELEIKSLKNKTVLITGSSRGIGRALAIGFAENGANVVLHCTKHNDAMDETENLLKNIGAKYKIVYGDLSDLSNPQIILDEVIKAFGNIDILVCNASIQIRNKWDKITDEEMYAQMKVNYFSTVKLIQSAVSYMKKNGFGRIITIGSTQQAKPHPDMLIYSASKCALENTVRSLALQLAEKGITVNNVAPGTIFTDRNKEVLADKEYYENVRNDIPIRIIGNPEDITGIVLLLASDSGRYITGENIFVDGGKFIQ